MLPPSGTRTLARCPGTEKLRPEPDFGESVRSQWYDSRWCHVVWDVLCDDMTHLSMLGTVL